MKVIDYIKQENEYEDFSYPEDVKRIVEVLKARSVEITPKEAEELWNAYSDDMCAQWLGLPDNDKELFDIIISQAKEKYNEDDEEW